MSNLVQNIIDSLKSVTTFEQLQDFIWIAGDLLAKLSFTDYRSGFEWLDKEKVTRDEGEQVKQALLDALNRSSEPRFVSAILSALGKSGDSSLKQLYVDLIARHLKMLKENNGVVYSAIIALDQIKEDVFEREPDGSSSQSILDVDKNIRQADRYLANYNILVSW